MSKKFQERMNEAFDIASIDDENLPQIVTPNTIKHDSLDIDLRQDYETIRENFHELIEKGKDAVDDILAIAKDSEKGRDFEVAAGMLKTIIEANEKLLDVHKKVREITNYKQQITEKTTINNALFVGSTAELSKMIKEINNRDLIEQ